MLVFLDSISLTHHNLKDRAAFKESVEICLMEMLFARAVARSGRAAVVSRVVTACFAPSHKRPQNKMGASSAGDHTGISTQAVRHGKEVLQEFINACFKSDDAFWPALRAYLTGVNVSYQKFLPASVSYSH